MDFPPIEDYGAIGNDDRIALVDRTGSIDWCCLPHLESGSVFARILDLDRGGHFSVRPAVAFEADHEYLDRTTILERTFETDGGTVTVTDFMPLVEGEPPYGSYQHAIHRKLTGRSGSVDLAVTFEPRFDYARAETTLATDDGAVVATGDGHRLHLTGADLTVEDDRARGTVTVDAGETRWLSLQYDHRHPLSDRECDRLLERTIGYWRTWMRECEQRTTRLYDGRWAEEVCRSTLTLKLLVHGETGAIPAAATTSIPEEVGGDRNWDYRFNWIRDAKFTVQALYNLGQTEEAHRYFEWFLDVAHDDPEGIQPIYGLHGERDLSEDLLDHLGGYRDSRPVRVGNAAYGQLQLDSYGTIIQGLYETVRQDRELPAETWADVCGHAAFVCDNWDRPDASIWEFRGVSEHFVHSKLLAWVALDRALELANRYDHDAPTDRWATERDAIREAILEHGYSEEVGCFVQHFDTDTGIDATALLIPIYGMLPPEDERVQSTIDTVLEELTTEEGLVYRFKGTDVERDERTAFLLCSFWLVDALVLSGRLEEALSIFERVLQWTTPLDLLSEKVDPETGDRLGNFPQAFSHIGLINSAVYLTAATAGGVATDPDEPEEPEEVAAADIDSAY